VIGFSSYFCGMDGTGGSTGPLAAGAAAAEPMAT
jgi:hypothetical protein